MLSSILESSRYMYFEVLWLHITPYIIFVIKALPGQEKSFLLNAESSENGNNNVIKCTY